VKLVDRDFDNAPPTIREVRNALAELRSQERNYGPTGDVAHLCSETHVLLEWIVVEYLRSDEP